MLCIKIALIILDKAKFTLVLDYFVCWCHKNQLTQKVLKRSGPEEQRTLLLYCITGESTPFPTRAHKPPSLLKTPAALCCDLLQGLMPSDPIRPNQHKPTTSSHLHPQSSHHQSHSQSFPYPSKTTLKPPLNPPRPQVDAAPAPA